MRAAGAVCVLPPSAGAGVALPTEPAGSGAVDSRSRREAAVNSFDSDSAGREHEFVYGDASLYGREAHVPEADGAIDYDPVLVPPAGFARFVRAAAGRRSTRR